MASTRKISTQEFSASSLIKQLAIRLSSQANLSLVIPRKRESSGLKQKAFENNWIPAFAGMTVDLMELHLS